MSDQPAIDLPGVTVWHGDCIDVMRELPDNSIDAIVTDPPYGLGFMGKAWDDLPPGLDWAVECLRVLKPGGHLLAFGGTRTWHRLAVAVEDAGFEIRDSIAWLYGSGFPKSLDVGKAIDKAAGAQRDRVPGTGGMHRGALNAPADSSGSHIWTTEQTSSIPVTPDAERWNGWGTALKPAFEPVVVARKPLTGTVAPNVTAWGTGGLNIDACRIGAGTPVPGGGGLRGGSASRHEGWQRASHLSDDAASTAPHTRGRWPANVALDGTQAAALDQQTGDLSYNPPGRFGTQKVDSRAQGSTNIGPRGEGDGIFGYGNRGGASRFFPTFRYQAKAPTRERPSYTGDDGAKVAHATVKPVELMRWLVRLITPPGGTVLDPFAGSGTTLEAARAEGFTAVGIERETDYLPLIVQRLTRDTPEPEPVHEVELEQPAAQPSIAGDQPGLFELGPRP